jgi:hypothetical protein
MKDIRSLLEVISHVTWSLCWLPEPSAVDDAAGGASAIVDGNDIR